MSLCKKIIETKNWRVCKEKACLRHTINDQCIINYKGPPRYSGEEDIVKIESDHKSSGLYPLLDIK